MAAPKKYIPENVGQRIRQLSQLGDGSRRISRAIAQEFGLKYSHTHIQNYLNSENQDSNLSMNPATTVTGPDNGHAELPVQKPAIAAWQMPDVHVNSIATPAPSTIIVPYERAEQLPRDSMEQVMLDLIRAQGLAEINHQYQAQHQSRHEIEDGMSKAMAKSESIRREREKQAQEKEEARREERATRLKELQEFADQVWRKSDSDRTEPGTTAEQTDLTIQGQNNLKNDQSPVDNIRRAVTSSPGPSPPPAGVSTSLGANAQLSPPTPSVERTQDTKPEFGFGAEPGTITEKSDLTKIQGQKDFKNDPSKSPVDNNAGAPLTAMLGPPSLSSPTIVGPAGPGTNVQHGILPPPDSTTTVPPKETQVTKLDSAEDGAGSDKQNQEQKSPDDHKSPSIGMKQPDGVQIIVENNRPGLLLSPVNGETPNGSALGEPTDSGHVVNDYKNTGSQDTSPNSPVDETTSQATASTQSPGANSKVDPGNKTEDKLLKGFLIGTAIFAAADVTKSLWGPRVEAAIDRVIVRTAVVPQHTQSTGRRNPPTLYSSKPEVRALQDAKLVDVNGKAKPPPPSLYSVQPQGDAANGFHIF